MELFELLFEADLREGQTSEDPNWDPRGQRYPGDLSPATFVVDTIDGIGSSVVNLVADLFGW